MDAPKFQWQALLVSILISIALSLILWGISALLSNVWGVVIPWWAWIIIILVFFFLFYYIMQKYAYNKAVKAAEEKLTTETVISSPIGISQPGYHSVNTVYSPTAIIG